MNPLRMREYIGCEEEVTLLKSQRDCAMEAEKRDAFRIMEALAGAHICTPEETYGTNTGWAISDLIRAFKQVIRERNLLEREARKAFTSGPDSVGWESGALEELGRMRS